MLKGPREWIKHVSWNALLDSRRGRDSTSLPGFPIVGIGASAGDLEAFQKFFDHAARFRYGFRDDFAPACGSQEHAGGDSGSMDFNASHRRPRWRTDRAQLCLRASPLAGQKGTVPITMET
jgi:hypothetical protein